MKTSMYMLLITILINCTVMSKSVHAEKEQTVTKYQKLLIKKVWEKFNSSYSNQIACYRSLEKVTDVFMRRCISAYTLSLSDNTGKASSVYTKFIDEIKVEVPVQGWKKTKIKPFSLGYVIEKFGFGSTEVTAALESLLQIPQTNIDLKVRRICERVKKRLQRGLQNCNTSNSVDNLQDEQGGRDSQHMRYLALKSQLRQERIKNEELRSSLTICRFQKSRMSRSSYHLRSCQRKLSNYSEKLRMCYFRCSSVTYPGEVNPTTPITTLHNQKTFFEKTKDLLIGIVKIAKDAISMIYSFTSESFEWSTENPWKATLLLLLTIVFRKPLWGVFKTMTSLIYKSPKYLLELIKWLINLCKELIIESVVWIYRKTIYRNGRSNNPDLSKEDPKK